MYDPFVTCTLMICFLLCFTDKVSSPTGVCAGKTGRIPNNLIIISANNKNGNYTSITEKQLAYLTAHEIAGALGALPDGDGGEDVCDQFLDEHKNPRHYLMWPDVLRNTTLKEHSLSSCSKKYIVKTLSTCKSACFDIDRHPFCGNGLFLFSFIFETFHSIHKPSIFIHRYCRRRRRVRLWK